MGTASVSKTTTDQERVAYARMLSVPLRSLVEELIRLERQASADVGGSEFVALDERVSVVRAALENAPASFRDNAGPRITVTSTRFAPWPITFRETFLQIDNSTKELRRERSKLFAIDRTCWRRIGRELGICWQVLGDFLSTTGVDIDAESTPIEPSTGLPMVTPTEATEALNTVAAQVDAIATDLDAAIEPKAVTGSHKGKIKTVKSGSTSDPDAGASTAEDQLENSHCETVDREVAQKNGNEKGLTKVQREILRYMHESQVSDLNVKTESEIAKGAIGTKSAKKHLTRLKRLGYVAAKPHLGYWLTDTGKKVAEEIVLIDASNDAAEKSIRDTRKIAEQLHRNSGSDRPLTA